MSVGVTFPVIILAFIASMLFNFARSYKIIIHNNVRKVKSVGRLHSTFSGTILEAESSVSPNGDELITALNGRQDITVKAINCREAVQEMMLRGNLGPVAGKIVAELSICNLMLGAGIKGQETFQINIVGNDGLRYVTSIVDGDLRIKSKVADPNFNIDSKQYNLKDLFGDIGQVQVVRNHPTWKSPQNGIVELRSQLDVATNIALYLGESEQRKAALITDVFIEGGLCRHALGLMIETLPGASDANVETSISNMEKVAQRGLRSYLNKEYDDPQMPFKAPVDNLPTEGSPETSGFRDFKLPLMKMIDDCLDNVNVDFDGEIETTDMGLRWSKFPTFKCDCDVSRVWRALSMLPIEDKKDIVEEGKPVEIKCDFCGENYVVSTDEVKERFDL